MNHIMPWLFLTQYEIDGMVPAVMDDLESFLLCLVGDPVVGYDIFGQYIRGRVVFCEDEFAIVEIRGRDKLSYGSNCGRLLDHYGLLTRDFYQDPDGFEAWDPVWGNDHSPRFWRLA